MNTRSILLIVFLSYFFSNGLTAQINLTISNTITSGNGHTCVPITVENFDDVIGFQFSLTWNPDELSFDSLSNEGLLNMNFNTMQAADGMLAVIWDEPNLNGQSLSDDAVLFEICFTANGLPDDVFTISFSETPTPCTFVQYDGTNLLESVANKINGTVTVASPMTIINETVTTVSCFNGSNGNISFNVEGGTPPYSYNWNPSQPNANTIENLMAGIYNLTITDALGDTLTNSFEVFQPAIPLNIDGLAIPDLTCQNLSDTVEVVAIGGTSPYDYQLNGASNTTGVFPNIAQGDYLLTITDANGCSLEEDFLVSSPEFPSVNIIGDTISCGNPLPLVATGDNGSYVWFLDGNDLNINQNGIEATTLGLYQVVLTNDDFCADTAAINIIFAPPVEAVIETNAFEICPNDTVMLFPMGGQIYSWIGQNLTLNANQTATFSPTESGLYIFDLVATDEYNCQMDTTSVEIFVFEPQGFVAEDTCIAVGGTVELTAFNGLNYVWTDNDFPVSNSEIANPSAEPEQSTTYVVAIEDENTCVVSDSILVEVVNNPFDFITPINVITPNGDGENDVLKFETLEKFPTNRLVVFNRWGGEVYRDIQYQNDWGGTYNGKKLPTGEYYYVLYIGNEEKPLKSTLMILNDE